MRLQGRVLPWLCGLLCLCAWAAGEAPESSLDAGEAVEPLARPGDSRWYVMTGAINLHPRFRDARELIDRRLNRPFRILAPGFEDVRTFADERDDFAIWMPFVGAGRTVGDHWEVFGHAGFTRGRVTTRQDRVSLLLLPLYTDVSLTRTSLYVGGGVTYYPWGFPRRDRYEGIAARLAEARPFIMSSLNWNYLGFEGRVKARFRPFPSILDFEERDRWRPWSTNVTIGVDVPLTARTVATVHAQYNIFLDHHADFGGPGMAIFLKRFF